MAENRFKHEIWDQKWTENFARVNVEFTRKDALVTYLI